MRNLLFIILVLGGGIFIGQQGTGNLLKKALRVAQVLIGDDDINTTVVENENTEEGNTPVPTRQGDILGSPNSTEKFLDVQVLDEFNRPLGDVCLILRNNKVPLGGVIVTNSADGTARLTFNQIADNQEIELVLDPYTHTNPVIMQRNVYPMLVSPDMYGTKLCFRRLNPAQRNIQQKDFELIPCGQTITQQATATPEPTPTIPVLPTEPVESKPQPETGHIKFIDQFEDNRNDWELKNFKNHSESIDGSAMIQGGGLSFLQYFSQDFRFHRTDIPLAGKIKNFGYKIKLVSTIQPSNEGQLARFNMQMRVQEDRSYYNFAIDHDGVVTFSRILSNSSNGEPIWEIIDEFEPDGYLKEQGAENEIFIEAIGHRFTMTVNGGKPRELVNPMRNLDQAGGMSLAVDGTAGHDVGYKVTSLEIQEWADDVQP